MRATARPRTIRGVTTNTALRIALLIWIVGYLVVSCAPILGGHLLIGAIVILVTLIWLTNERRPP